MTYDIEITRLRACFDGAQNGSYATGTSGLPRNIPGDQLIGFIENLNASLIAGLESSVRHHHKSIANLSLFWTCAQLALRPEDPDIGDWKKLWKDEEGFIEYMDRREGVELQIFAEMSADHDKVAELVEQSQTLWTTFNDIKGRISRGRPAVDSVPEILKNGAKPKEMALQTRAEMVRNGLDHVASYIHLAHTAYQRACLAEEHILPNVVDEVGGEEDHKLWRAYSNENIAVGQDILEAAYRLHEDYIPLLQHAPGRT